MRIGIISKASPDYLIDIVTDGMIRLLGRDNVCLDYSYRGGFSGFYSGLIQGFEGPEPFDIRDSDFLIASKRSLQPALAWSNTVKRKVAVIDGEDDDGIEGWALDSFSLYFKREYSRPILNTKVLPLPMAAIPEQIPPIQEDRTGVFFVASAISHPFRREVNSVLLSMGIPVSEEKFEKPDYNRMLTSSQIGVAVRGIGWDTYRYWETPYFGCCLLAQQPRIIIPNNFENGREAVFFHEIKDFKNNLRWLLDHQDIAKSIALAGKEASTRRHLSIHRAKTVLEALSS